MLDVADQRDPLAAREPAEGVIITIPPHTGDATLIFDLHNRHTYSEEDVRAGRERYWITTTP